MLHEGQKVTSLGSATAAQGEIGTVLAVTDQADAHVQWPSGQVTFERTFDLSPLATKRSLVEDSLEVGSLVTTAARDIYDDGGPAALLNHMAEDGHLAAFSDIAEEALGFIAGRVRSDASFRAICAQLDPEEGESLVRLASFALIRDAFTGSS